ncbi:hypothetical protein L484_016570 [Morus notabilis]|uniref:Uncharacterized protein n=1 Tax=Morus notabilis TaxID=981085 RepID=W9QSQ7_9ROSA|nr:hypothetical protein L484_016570 [Morus notabilis]
MGYRSMFLSYMLIICMVSMASSDLLEGIVDPNIIPDITGIRQVRVFGVVECPFPAATQRKTTLSTGTDVVLRCNDKRTTISDVVTDTNGFFEITFNTLETSLFHPNQCDRCFIVVRGTDAAGCFVSPARRGALLAPINCRDVVVERLHDEQGHRDVLHYEAGPFYFDPSY